MKTCCLVLFLLFCLANAMRCSPSCMTLRPHTRAATGIVASTLEPTFKSDSSSKKSVRYTSSRFMDNLYLIHRTISIQEPILRSGGSLRAPNMDFNHKHGFFYVQNNTRPGIYMSLNYILHDDENSDTMRHRQTVVIIPAKLLWSRLTNAAVNDMCLLGDVDLAALKGKVHVITTFPSTCQVMKKHGISTNCLNPEESIQTATFKYLKEKGAPILTPVNIGFTYFDRINVTTNVDGYKKSVSVLPKDFFDDVATAVQIGKEGTPVIPKTQYSMYALFFLGKSVEYMFANNPVKPLTNYALWPMILLMDIHIKKVEELLREHPHLYSLYGFIKEMKKRRFQLHLCRSFIVKYRFLPEDFSMFFSHADELRSMIDGQPLLMEHPEFVNDFLEDVAVESPQFSNIQTHQGDPDCEFRALKYDYELTLIDNINETELESALKNLKTMPGYKIAQRQELGFKAVFYGVKMVREGTGMIVSSHGENAASHYQNKWEKIMASLVGLDDPFGKYDVMGALYMLHEFADVSNQPDTKLVDKMFSFSESIFRNRHARSMTASISRYHFGGFARQACFQKSDYVNMLMNNVCFKYPIRSDVIRLTPSLIPVVSKIATWAF